MDKLNSLQRNLVLFGVPLSIISLLLLLRVSPLFQQNQEALSIGITFDLLILVPGIYFLLIRKTSIPKTTVVPFMILGLVLCSVFLPAENQQYVDLFKKWILPLVEITIVGYVLWKVKGALMTYRLNRDDSIDFFSALKNTCSEILPKKLVTPFATEIAVFYYGFFQWKKVKLNSNQFTLHKGNGTIALMAVLIFLILVETIVLHILLVRWSEIAAWIVTTLSFYSGLQIFGFLRSLSKRPILVSDTMIYLKYGIMSEATLKISDIESIELSSKEFFEDKNAKKLSILGDLESHNVVIHMKSEYQIIGLYGIKKNFKTLLVFLDKKEDFKNLVESRNLSLKHGRL
ncbi:hypothetical protein [Christiangramia forsetii]|uniref:Uncharacterized protein n=2 Tax=Christiangramia forsetii TaxID=411153 RepID=A0M756_CHRFK|nr:hypothetical protein [Christiangramia forsetii]GGG28676.1 hypothetical protein GCM10011532_10180 [Christiangramia forsetii]CAL68451.1 conserved hypothetical protein, membrane [Christiangramia forsetii KT0803]